MRPISKMLAVSEPGIHDGCWSALPNARVCGGASVTGASTPSPERRKKPHHELGPLLQGLAQLAVGAASRTSLDNSAIESFNAFCTLTEGLTSTWVSVSLAMM